MNDRRLLSGPMNWVKWRPLVGVACAAVMLGGCSTQESPVPTTAPVGVQLRRIEPTLQGSRFSILSSFESDAERVFVQTRGAGPTVDISHAHGGKRSLRIGADAREIRVNVDGLMLGRPFPADWTLMGAWFFSDRPTRVLVQRVVQGRIVGQRTVELPADQWTAALLEVALDQDQDNAHPGALVIRPAEAAGSTNLWLDDVMIVDNTRTLFSAEESSRAALAPWTIRQCGWTIQIDAPARFKLALPGPDGTRDGFDVLEAGAMRVRLESPSGKALCVYADGRAYRDGVYESLDGTDEAEKDLFKAQHDSPANMEVDPALGKLDRSTAGDANHDGYNEQRGAYQLRANGPRLALVLSPTTDVLVNPVLEITGLPEGALLATVEGQLVESVDRLDDGTVLVEVPARLRRPTHITVHVRGE